MTKTASTDTCGPIRYRHKRTVVEGVVYDGTVDCARAIVEWGKSVTEREPFVIEGDDLHARTPQGLRYVQEGDTAIIGVCGEAYSIEPLVKAMGYDEVDGVDYRTFLTTARVTELHAEAKHCLNPDRLREIVDQLAAHIEAVTA